jgi:hypothetical protein
MPLRDRVLNIHLSVPEESIHRSPDVLRELGQSNGIVLGCSVADLYLSPELVISTPLYENHGISSVFRNLLKR